MQKKSQTKLNLNYSKDVLDIVQFGSSVFENSSPNDIDIAVIYNKIPIKEQLEQSQKIKEQLEKSFSLPIHIKSYDLYSFFDKGNFARESIMVYGKSLISGKYFSEILGVFPRLQILYSLKELKKKDKVKFNYLLSGKGGEYGLLKEYGGEIIAPGIVQIFPEYEKVFTEEIKKITSSFKVKSVFL